MQCMGIDPAKRPARDWGAAAVMRLVAERAQVSRTVREA
jgi:hypothetical protein